MGQWVFFHTMRGWRFNTFRTPYTAAHDAAEADFVGESASLLVGQDAAGRYYILRAGLHFYTDNLLGLTILSARVALSQIFGGAIPMDSCSLHLVEGAGLNAPAIASDFGYLLDKTIPYGSLLIPDGGLVQEVYYEIPLNADGIAAINPGGWTRYGLRTSDDIESNDTHVLNDYIPIELRGSPFFTGLTRTVSAEPLPDGAILTGLLSEEGLTRKHIKLVVDVAEAGNFSNIDVRFWYRNTATGAEDTTPWKEHQEIEVPFSIEVTGLAPGTYQYRAQSRILLEDGSYSYAFSGEIKTFNTSGYYSQCSNEEDGYIENVDPDWDTVHDAASGLAVEDWDTLMIVAASLFLPEFWVERGFLYFDTSDIPPEATIISAILALFPYEVFEDNAGYATLHVVEGVQAVPLELEDYGGHLDKVVSGGSIAFADWIPDSYNEIELNAAGISWINKGGLTKFCLRVAADINDTPPTADNAVIFSSAEAGPDFCPKLSVAYELLPVVPPTLTTNLATDIGATSATLNGTLVDDGGEPCGCGFEWGETEAYEHGATPTQSKETPTGKYEYCHPSGDGYEKIDDTWWCGQSFTPQITHKITKLKLLLYKVGDPGTVTVSIRATDGFGRPTGPDLASVSFDGASLTTDTDGEEKEVTLAYEPTALIKYIIVMKATAMHDPPTNYVAWKGYFSTYPIQYERGVAHYSQNGGASWFEKDQDGYFWFEEWGNVSQPFSQIISGLLPGTTYHFRALATNEAGTGYGADRTFTTLGARKGNIVIDQLIYQHAERMRR